MQVTQRSCIFRTRTISKNIYRNWRSSWTAVCWVSYCCLAPSEQFFSHVMEITSYFWWSDDVLYWTLIVLAHCNNIPWVDMSLQWETLSKQSLFLLLSSIYNVLSEEVTNIKFIDFGLAPTGIEPTGYVALEANH
jgi:hypothetical protein